MADIQITPVGQSNQATLGANRPMVWVTLMVAYHFYQRNDDFNRGSLWYIKTTNKGQTWGGATKVSSAAAALNKALGFSCWYDKWTPGDVGTKIHISFQDSAAGSFRYGIVLQEQP